MPGASRTFRVFVSSTFSDLKAERNALQERVFPRLRALCMRHDCRFQAIDLRWGVTEEASLDQRTMQICLDEIVRCQQVTPRPNFLILLGDRYGWRPLPFEIGAEEFEALALASSGADRELLVWSESQPAGRKGWYRRDDNALEPVYVLQPRSGEYREPATWASAERELRRILNSAATVASAAAERAGADYDTSATEWEVVRGALDTPDPHIHAFAFFRSIEGLPDDASAAAFVDLDPSGQRDRGASLRLEALKERLRNRLPGNVREYRAQWAQNEVTTAHLDQFCEDVFQSLAPVIEGEIARLESVDPLEQEKEAHALFAQERSRHFAGRAEPLRRIEEHLSGAASQPLLVTGPSGIGKTALLGRALADARRRHQGAVVLGRFIGATPGSIDPHSLLRGISEQVYADFGLEALKRSEMDALGPARAGDDYADAAAAIGRRYALGSSSDDLVRLLGLIPANGKLLLIIDALDQLVGLEEAQFDWLIRLPRTVRVVVSSLPDPRIEALLDRLAGFGAVDVGRLAEAEAGTVLHSWLVDAGRTLQLAQEEVLLQGFRTSASPLHLKLAFEEARRWPSFLQPAEIPGEILGMLDVLFARLVRDHGEELVSRSLGYLCAARYGLSEDELLDLLARDDDFVREFLRSARHALPSSEEGRPALPVVLWSRLYFDLEPYLMERRTLGGTVLGFYHRLAAEAARRAFLPGRREDETHQRLAAFFSGQPSWQDAGTPNSRKATELLFHVERLGTSPALHGSALDGPLLEAKMAVGLQDELYGELTRLWEKADSQDGALIAGVLEGMAADWAVLRRHPGSLFQCLWNRCWWTGRETTADPLRAAASALSAPVTPGSSATLGEFMERWLSDRERQRPGEFWMCRTAPPGEVETPLDDEDEPDSGPKPWGRHHLLSPDGSCVVDATIFSHVRGKPVRPQELLRIWDRRSLALVRTLPLPEGASPALRWDAGWTPDGRLMLGGFSGLTLVDPFGEAAPVRFDHNIRGATSFHLTPDCTRAVTCAGTEPEPPRRQRPVAPLLASGPSAPIGLPQDGTAEGHSSDVDEDDGELRLTFSGTAARLPAEEREIDFFLRDQDDTEASGAGDSAEEDAFDLVRETHTVLHADPAEVRPAEGEVAVWGVADGRPQLRVLHPHGVNQVAISPEGTRIAFACYGARVHLYDVDSGVERWWQATSSAVIDLCFSPDGRRVGAREEFRGDSIWDAESGELIGGSGENPPIGGTGCLSLRSLIAGSRDSPWLLLDHDGTVEIQWVPGRKSVARVPARHLVGTGDRRWREPGKQGEWVLMGSGRLPPPGEVEEWPWFLPEEEEDFSVFALEPPDADAIGEVPEGAETGTGWFNGEQDPAVFAEPTSARPAYRRKASRPMTLPLFLAACGGANLVLWSLVYLLVGRTPRALVALEVAALGFGFTALLAVAVLIIKSRR